MTDLRSICVPTSTYAVRPESAAHFLPGVGLLLCVSERTVSVPSTCATVVGYSAAGRVLFRPEDKGAS